MTTLSGWGRYPRVECRSIAAPKETVAAQVASATTLIARGNGRAYGDCAVNPNLTLAMLGYNRDISFDEETGLLSCEAGVLLSDLIALVLPRGWFPPVTPGTKYVTIGGMVAADVHGKNHHRVGSFGNHITELTLVLADGCVMTCSPSHHSELFAATIGGMGLTGVILRCAFQLIAVETRTIRRQTLRARNLSEVMDFFEAAQSWTYSVAWIDSLSKGNSLGRSILQLGEHLRMEELPATARRQALLSPARVQRRVPIDFPSFTLNRFSVRAFNALYYARARPGADCVDLDTFFYPLDALLDWNRIYGRAGFIQYQCVVPLHASLAALTLLLDRSRELGAPSFLSVLKRFGPQDGLLSFPMEGYTLALDLPVSQRTLAIANELDAIVADHGGRLYLAKDSRMPPAMMQGYHRASEFRAIRQAVDPSGKFASAQSIRLGL